MWLHRAIERGHASDEIWAELSKVCYHLGKKSEALRGIGNIEDPEYRRWAERYLVEKGLMECSADESRLQEKVEQAEQERRGAEASAEEDQAPTTMSEEVADSFAYLFIDHMPVTVMASTLVFPVVLGLGGILTAGSDFWVLPAIALLPVLCVLGLVGALARRILIESSRGSTDAPRIPEPVHLFRTAGRFLRDGLLVVTALLGPGILAAQLGLPLNLTLPLLIMGGFFVPMALALCQMRNDWRAVSPRLVLPAIARCGVPYLCLVSVAALLLTPAILVIGLTGGSDLYLRLSFVGPLAIAPLFVAARLMGRVLLLREAKLGDLIRDESGVIDAEFPRESIVEVARESGTSGSTPGRLRQRTVAKPKELGRLDAPVHPEMAAEGPTAAANSTPTQKSAAEKTAASKAEQAKAAQAKAAQAKAARAKAAQAKAAKTKAAQAKAAQAKAAQAKAAKSKAAQKRKETAAAQTESEQTESAAKRQMLKRLRRTEPALAKVAPETRKESHGLPQLMGDTGPDLLNIPGATVLRGEERSIAGAAADRPPS